MNGLNRRDGPTVMRLDEQAESRGRKPLRKLGQNAPVRLVINALLVNPKISPSMKRFVGD